MRRLMTAACALAVAVVLAIASHGPGFSQDKAKPAGPPATEVATFAGGCFWCVETDFDKVDGVVSTISGFMGGRTANPTYKQVTSGDTGHIEVVQVTFDPAKVTYQKLVDHFWRTIDPYDAGGQFCDRGEAYTTAIFTHSPEQKRIAEASKSVLSKDGPRKEPIATKVRDAGPFTAAEEYHQDYYKKNPLNYRFYRYGCGRDAKVEAIWGKKVTN